MRSRILLGTLAGGLGGFVGILIVHATIRFDPILDLPARDSVRLGLLIGAAIGLAIGAVEGVCLSSPRVLLRGMVLGAAVGGLGGIVGTFAGGEMTSLVLFGKSRLQLETSPAFLDFVHLVFARAVTFAVFGPFIGLAAGAATLSRKRALHGMLGGLIGGLLAGILFDPLAKVLAPLMSPLAAGGAAGTVEINGQHYYEAGGPSRTLGFTLLGLFTGLFIGLVSELLKQGWVRVLAGKNEGRDYILDKPLTVIGRDERADVPVFGDPSLMPQHAAIRLENGRHFLLAGGAPPPPVVNGQVVQQKQILKDGDMIQLGQVRLLFRERATAARVGRGARDASAPPTVASPTPVPSHLCPYCGAQKDASGNCLCSLGPAAAPASPAPASSAYSGSPPVGTPLPMGARLVGLVGPYAGQGFAIHGPVCEIGREPGLHVALGLDNTVSRRHARIVEENGRHVVYDEGSSNGTFVNGVRVTVQALAPGDTVQFGSSQFRYE